MKFLDLFKPSLIGRLIANRDIDGLITIVESNVDNNRYRAAKALKKLGCLDKLIDMLKNDSVSLHVIEVLGDLKEHKAVEPLIGLLNNTREDLRIGASWALKRIESIKAMSALENALDDDNWYVRVNAARALHNIKYRPSADTERVNYCRALIDADYSDGWSTIVEYGDAAISPLISALENRKGYTHIIRSVVRTLGKIGNSSAITPLTNLMMEEPVSRRGRIAEALAEIEKRILNEEVKIKSASQFVTVQQKFSGFWRCPSCRTILVKPSHGIAEDFMMVTGTATCNKCGHVFSQSVVYGGQYDVPEVRTTCRHCRSIIQGPSELLCGKPCPSCARPLTE